MTCPAGFVVKTSVVVEVLDEVVEVDCFERGVEVLDDVEEVLVVDDVVPEVVEVEEVEEVDEVLRDD